MNKLELNKAIRNLLVIEQKMNEQNDPDNQNDMLKELKREIHRLYYADKELK